MDPGSSLADANKGKQLTGAAAGAGAQHPPEKVLCKQPFPTLPPLLLPCARRKGETLPP